MPRQNRRSKAADRKATKKAAAKRRTKKIARGAMTLAQKILALEPHYTRREIAEKLGTSRDYVRVVLGQRRMGWSEADRRYEHSPSGRAVRRRRWRGDYHEVPRGERLEIRARVRAELQGVGLTPKQVATKASMAVIAEGRRRRRENTGGAHGV